MIGPPGTGKTTALAKQCRHSVEKYGKGRVLVSSFTRAAAAEIGGRDIGVEPDMVGTLHALCYRQQGRPEIAETKADDWNEKQPGLELSSARKNRLDDPDDPTGMTDGDTLLGEVQRLRSIQLPERAWPDDRVVDFWHKWQRWKNDEGLRDFTDLIEDALHMDTSAPGAPHVGVFDEVQDWGALELSLVRKWAESMDHVLLGGDPAQAIYAFKGAIPRAFLEPEIPEADYRYLRQSYRVPRAVRDLAVRWIDRGSYKLRADYLARDEDGLAEWLPDSNIHLPHRAVEMASEFERAGETTMILASCAYMLQATIVQLRQSGVPFHNPYRKTNGAWNPMRGGADRLRAFLVPWRTADKGAARFWRWGELRRWINVLKASGTLKMGAKTYVETAAKRDEESDKRASRPATREELQELFCEGAWRSMRAAFDGGDPVLWLLEHSLTSKKKLLSYAANIASTRGWRTLWDRPKVIVGTVHSVKGGEADHVFLAPDLSAAGWEEWQSTGERRDSVRRMFYVGMTRARQSLHIFERSNVRAVDWEL